MMKNSVLEAVIVGAGHAGLSASYYLAKQGLKHIVIEKGKIGESWRSQRWDSFVLNTPNAFNGLPGDFNPGLNAEEFCSAGKFVSLLEAYARKYQLPVMEHTQVMALEKKEDQSNFTITLSKNGNIEKCLSRQVIICSGGQNKKQFPSITGKILPGIVQLHAGEYKNSSQLPGGGVLVVGSGQSGCQVAEDIIASGRKVYLSISSVPRMPRRYRGKDIMEWLILAGFFEANASGAKDQKMKTPLLTGVGDGKRTLSFQSLAKMGIVLLGKMDNVNGNVLSFESNVAGHIQFADGFSQNIKDLIDNFIEQSQLNIPAPQVDIDDMPDANAGNVPVITSIDLVKDNIRSIIWATGFNADFSYIKLPILDMTGRPEHVNGIDGLYFLGLSWLRTRKTSLIYGIKDDARIVCDKVIEYAQMNSRSKKKRA